MLLSVNFWNIKGKKVEYKKSLINYFYAIKAHSQQQSNLYQGCAKEALNMTFLVATRYKFCVCSESSFYKYELLIPAFI